jgi:Ni/Fe-hydrogenase 1 B-type cytochrome subunit
MSGLESYLVWDKTTRIFHWINAVCILLLLMFGLMIMNHNAIGIDGSEELILKKLHTSVGYVFITNLIWRYVWGFIGNHYARWGAILPFHKGFLTSLKEYMAGFKSGKYINYLGHNPAARISITLLFLLITIQALTGLVIAGTDIFYPPFGGFIQEWIAPAGVNPGDLVPGARDMYDPDAYTAMREFRAPILKVHEINSYLLMLFIPVHILSVIVSDIKEGNGIISAMFTGKKVFDSKPIDSE